MTCPPALRPVVTSATQLTDAVKAVLCYFEIFKYPMTAAEITQWICPGHGDPVSADQVQAALDQLVEAGRVYQYDQYYQTRPEADWLPQRLDNNQRATEFLPRAERMSRFIMGFPFVRAVMVSGSLSKHVMRPDGDIDFFIVTEPGRLWLARTLMVAFKKIFLFNSHKLFCINYFVDTAHLTIEEQNRFTATEVVTLLPMQGRVWQERFVAANTWAWSEYFPQMPIRAAANLPAEDKVSTLKWSSERLLNSWLGAQLDSACMRFTLWYWKRKFKHLDTDTFDLSLKTRRYVSKHHPQGFQQRVLTAFAQRMGEV
jgi:hypothetical protein